MLSAPKASVLMTAYNREAYIADAIESVLGQTFDDFELVIVDDGSSDRTVAIAQEYERRDRRVRVVINERNLGDYGNRNRAASFARGEFLKYHDSDDLMYPHCLSIMVAALESVPAAGFALSGSRAWPGGPCPMLSTPRMSFQREFLGYGMFHLGPACALFRTSILRELGGFTDLGAASDYVFWLRACARYPVLLLPGDLFWYRTHAGQELRSARAVRDYARVPGHAWRALAAPDCPLEPNEREQAKRNQAYGTGKAIWHAVRRGRPSLAAFMLRHCGMSTGDWLVYLRPPRRSVEAGSPLDAAGQYLTPAQRSPVRATRVS